MAITNEEVLNSATKHVGKRKNQAKRQRSSSPSESIRYFVGKPGGAKPSLDQEVPGEAEGLVIGFKTDARLFVVHEYEVGQKIEREGFAWRKLRRPAVNEFLQPTKVE